MIRYSETERTAVINTATSGDNSIIAAPGSGKRLYIDFVTLLPTTAVSVTFYSGAAGTALSGPLPLDAKQAMTVENASQVEHGVLECADNTAFVINLGAAVQVGGFVRYRIGGE